MTDRRSQPVPTPDNGEPAVAPRRFPGWTPPPLPGGPNPTTPGGYSTVKSGTGLRSDTLVGPGHRVPILFGRCLISPDLAKAAPEVASGVTRGRYHAVISEGPIDAIESWYGATDFHAITTTLGSLSPTAGMPSWSIGLAAANILTKGTQPWFPQCIARGRLPYDPRLGAWGAGVYPDPTKCAYSTNPALCYVDLRVHPQYGCDWPKVTPALVDWTSVAAAADHFDELVGSEKRYELNLYLQASDDADTWLKTIELHAGLRWREEGGLYRLDYSAPTATVAAAITRDHVVKGTKPHFGYGSGAGLADRPNVFVAEWVDPASNWSTRTVTVKHPAVEAGTEAARPARTYQLHGFQSEAMALRALWRIAHEIWSEQELECELTTERLDLVEGTRVPVVLPSIGLSGAEFLVTRTSYDGDRVRITARRYDATTWSDPGDTSGDLPGTGFFDTPADVADIVIAHEEVTTETDYSTHTLQRCGFRYSLPTSDYLKQLRVRIAAYGIGVGSVVGVVVVSGGTGYAADDPVTILGEGTSATAKVGTVNGSGAIQTVTVTAGGSGYHALTTSAVAGGSGSGAVLRVDRFTGITAPDPATLTWGDPEMVRNEYVLPLFGNRTPPDAGDPWIVIEDGIGAEAHTVALPYGGTSEWESNPAWRAIVKVESLAGVLSSGVTIDRAAGLVYSSTTAATTAPVERSTTTPPTAGQIPKFAADLSLVDSGLVPAALAPLASPALTGTPTAPTATAGTNTTQIATTEFVTTAVAGVGGGKVLRAEAFLAGGTWTAPTGVTEAWITACAGGGGGGKSSGNYHGGGGGGAAAFVLRKRVTVSGGTGYTVTIGAGGNGATGTQNAQAGGTTSFGALLSLSGGAAGGNASSTQGGAAGARGGEGGTSGQQGSQGTNTSGGTGGVGGIAGPGGWGSGGGGAPGQSNLGFVGGSGYVLVEWNE